MSLLARILAALVSALALAGAIVMGFFVGAALVGIALLGGLALAGRLWWLRRKLRRAQTADAQRADPNVIEGEFRVVEAASDESRRSLP